MYLMKVKCWPDQIKKSVNQMHDNLPTNFWFIMFRLLVGINLQTYGQTDILGLESLLIKKSIVNRQGKQTKMLIYIREHGDDDKKSLKNYNKEPTAWY